MGRDLLFRHTAIQFDDVLWGQIGNLGFRAPKEKRMRLLEQQRLLQIEQPFVLIAFFLGLLKPFHELFRRTQ